MFKCMQKQFNLCFSPSSFTLDSALSLWAQFSLLLTCRHQSSSDPTESIFTLLSPKKSTFYFLVWFVTCGPGKKQQLTEVRQSRGCGLEPGGEGGGTARQNLLVHTARSPQQSGFFSVSIKCMFAVLHLHSLTLFPRYNFFQLLQSWSKCVHICAPLIDFIMVLCCVSNKGEMWRILPGSSQFSKLFCCFPSITISQILFPFSSFKIQ